MKRTLAKRLSLSWAVRGATSQCPQCPRQYDANRALPKNRPQSLTHEMLWVPFFLIRPLLEPRPPPRLIFEVVEANIVVSGDRL